MTPIYTRACKICGKTQDLFTLDFKPEDTDAGIEWSVYVCGSCWEIIATIARRVAQSVVKDMVTEAVQ